MSCTTQLYRSTQLGHHCDRTVTFGRLQFGDMMDVHHRILMMMGGFDGCLLVPQISIFACLAGFFSHAFSLPQLGLTKESCNTIPW